MASLTKALGLCLFLLDKIRRNKKGFEFNHDMLGGLMDQGPRGSPWEFYPMGPRMAHDLLKGVRQGGVDFKLFQINLVGLLRKLDSLIGLGLFSCNRLGLDTCPYPLPYIKRGTLHLQL